jgi:large subunit ribosomal protein L11
MAPKSKKEIKNTIKLEIAAGAATPAPPLGPILGQSGINIQAFCQEFNEKTRERAGQRLPVVLYVFKDNTYQMVIKQPTVASMVLNAAKAAKGSATPNKDKVGSITMQQAKEIAEKKMPDLNTSSIEAATKIVAGTAKSLGIDVK